MRDREYTNRGMMACLFDQIPVGVMQRIKLKPNPQYRILGLGLASG